MAAQPANTTTKPITSEERMMSPTCPTSVLTYGWSHLAYTQTNHAPLDGCRRCLRRYSGSKCNSVYKDHSSPKAFARWQDAVKVPVGARQYHHQLERRQRWNEASVKR